MEMQEKLSKVKEGNTITITVSSFENTIIVPDYVKEKVKLDLDKIKNRKEKTAEPIEEAPAEPEISSTDKLLIEIRDLLKKDEK